MPYTLSTLNNLSLSTNEIFNAKGEKVYFAVYTYVVAGEDSILSISTETEGVDFTVVAGTNEDNVVSKNSDGNLSFTFLVSSNTKLSDIPVSITLTPVPVTTA